MIEKIKISNFKSIEELELDLGRINVLIGENGCGKTNILEGIGFGALGVQMKLDNEFLYSRGIRSSEYNEAFFNTLQPAKFQFKESVYHSWSSSFVGISGKNLDIIPGVDYDDSLLETVPELRENEKSDKTDHFKRNDGIMNFFLKQAGNAGLQSFQMFTLEYSSLVSFSEAGQIVPVGIHGEGLFKELQKILQNHPDKWKEIKEGLEALDWFENIEIPKDLFIAEKRIQLKDKYLGANPDVQFLDQRSANEGFLFLLFYFTLFVSDDTPKFFAIDNIDQALNPRLCIKLMQTLTEMAKKHDKQVIFTTHNPSILDGLDLKDDDQRLFVVYRNADGNTVAKRHVRKEGMPGVESARLSEAFIRGYLGGLPTHF